MISLIVSGDFYVIYYYSTKYLNPTVCVLPRNFLAKQTQNHIEALRQSHFNGTIMYPLNTIQTKAVSGIFKKIEEEQSSSYIFSRELLRLYFIELIHVITKMTRPL
jgi:reverse gyrase